ncbi:MAG: hypothetical protein JST20_03410 [Bacteroidetes bacterium]|nr:hypothetical protein [Bacteroidota bacterium]
MKGTTEISFLYDGMGNRVRKFANRRVQNVLVVVCKNTLPHNFEILNAAQLFYISIVW